MQGLITVFGGTGFVGRYVVRELARRGWRVRAAARRPDHRPELRVMGAVGQVSLFPCNVRDKASIAEALDGAEGVVNLVGIGWQFSGQKFAAVHTQASAEIARGAAARGIGRFVQMSALGADANSPAGYARTKAEAEAAVKAALPGAAILRPSLIFGPEDDFFNRFAAMAAVSPVLPLVGGGETRFQPVYAGDVGAAIANIIEDPEHLGGRTYELGGPGAYTFKALMQIILRETLRSNPLLPIPFPLAAPLGAAGDIQGAFGMKPQITSDQITLLKTDNVPAPGAPGLAALGVQATPLESVLPTYLWRFRKGGQFAQPETANA